MLTTLTAQGAIADVREIRDAAMGASSTLLTSAAANFTAADVGKAIVVGKAGPSSAKLVATIASFVSESSVNLSTAASTAVTNVGAAFGTDCSAALQDGIEALSAARGGILEINGLFLLAQPVSHSFGGEVDSIQATIRGTGTDSAIWIAIAGTADAITLSSAEIDFRDVSFIGVPDASLDARRILSLSAIASRLDRVGFYGLIASQGVIHASGCSIATRDCSFGGSFASHGGTWCVIENKNWAAYSDEGSEFIDYGYFRSRFYGKSGYAGSLGWVRADTPTTGERARGEAVFRMRDTRLDEGSFHGIVIKPTSGTVPHVELDGIRQNITAAETGRGIHCEDVVSVVVRNAWQGLATIPTLAAHFQDCGTVLIDSLKVSDSVNKLSATNVEALIFKDTVGITTFTFTNVNFHPVNSRYGNMALVKSGAISDADFPSPPALGTEAFDRTNNRLYVKRVSTGGWIYFNTDGGDVLGPELVVNGTGSSGTTGWTAANGGVLSNDAGTIRVTNGGVFGRAYQAVSTVIGQQYVFAVTIPSGTTSRYVKVGHSAGDGSNLYITDSAGGTGTFTATHATTYITLGLGETAGYANFDNISLRAM